MMQLSAFDQLQVPVTANDDVIKTAYLEMLRHHSPDQDPKRFEEIRYAYEQIATQEKRWDYILFQTPVLGFSELLDAMMKKTIHETQVLMPNGELLRSLLKESLHAQ